jgi:hypothetical protein
VVLNSLALRWERIDTGPDRPLGASSSSPGSSHARA